MIELPTESEPVRVVHGDCREVLPTLAADSFDSIVCDPPYGLVEPRSGMVGMKPRTAEQAAAPRGGFMGKAWDAETPGVDVWGAVLRVLKSGGYAAIFGATRTYHRLACAVEDAGFEIRDCLMWVYGTGFPKGQGCLKPAWEPILLARKPGKRVLPLGIDACRVPLSANEPYSLEGKVRPNVADQTGCYSGFKPQAGWKPGDGRYPANVLHDGSDEVMEAFAAFGERSGPRQLARRGASEFFAMGAGERTAFDDAGTAARFFYCAKASKAERGAGNTHPTVKPLSLMRWLVRLVTPPGGRLLDPFAGSGTTLLAADAEGLQAVGIEQDAGHCDIIRRRTYLARVKQPGLFEDAG